MPAATTSSPRSPSGAALALAPVVDELGITSTVFGTPAEEGGGGKIELLERGAFDGEHAAVMVHPGPVDVARAEPFAVSHSQIAYDGKVGHAAAYPERGVNAADAFTVAQVAIGLLRQQLPSGVRVHGMVTSGGEAPNAIPERTEGRWYVRAEIAGRARRAGAARSRRCFEAGALATRLRAGDRRRRASPTPSSAPTRRLLALLRRNARRRSGRTFATSGPDMRMNRASTDMGNVSQVLPAIHPYIGIDSLPAVNHQQEFAAAAIAAGGDASGDRRHGAARPGVTPVIDAASNPATRSRLLTADHMIPLACAASTICSATRGPADAYYGVHTARALENFPITGVPICPTPDLVVALAR